MIDESFIIYSVSVAAENRQKVSAPCSITALFRSYDIVSANKNGFGRPVVCVCVCVCALTGRSNRSSSTPAGVVPGVSDEAAAAATGHGRCRHCSAAADHHRTGH